MQTEVTQGLKNNNNFNGKKAYNNSPKVQFKFCFGPKEIYKILQLLEDIAKNPKLYTEVKSQKSLSLSRAIQGIPRILMK